MDRNELLFSQCGSSAVEDSLHSLFEAAVLQFADKNCIISVSNTGFVTYTYDDLDRCAKELCDSFISASPGFVGIVDTELTAQVVVCIIGILKSSQAFVFLNAADVENVKTSIRKLNVRRIIGQNRIVRKLFPEISDIQFDFVENKIIFGQEFSIWSRQIEKEASQTFFFAFAVFSSRSTKSTSKIIKVPHRSILPNILDLKKLYQLIPNDILLILTPLTFDPCIHDIFLAISAGCCILLVESAVKYESRCVRSLFSTEGFNVTVFFCTPSVFQKWFPHIWPCSLRILILGGERFPPIRQLTNALLSGVKIYNIYGVTELSCWASVSQIHSSSDVETVSLGSLLSDIIFEVRDDYGVVIAEGIGELFIGSMRRICVVDDDLECLEKRPCFRATGDLVKVFNDQYFYIGRKDRIIKLYGHQIDLSLIEIKIANHCAVKSCSVFTVGDAIIAMVELIASTVTGVTAEVLREFVSFDLPPHMLPNEILIIPELPLNSHGKISPVCCEALYCRLKIPRNISEEFRDLWINYTKQSSIDSTRGFLDSGGNSFVALQLIAALERIVSVPRNMIDCLLSNKSFSDCCVLINSNREDEKLQYIVPYTEKQTVETKDMFSESAKNMSNRYLSSALYKGSTLLSERDLETISELNLKWHYDLGKCVDASPTLIVYDNRTVVVCGSHSGYLVVIELETGVVLWKVKLPDRIESSACASEDGLKIFIGCYDGKMYAIDTFTGFINWSFQTNDIIKSTAILCKHLLFFGSYDHYFYCISSKDGVLQWKVNIDNCAIYVTAVVRNDIIIVCTLGGTVAFVDYSGIIRSISNDLKPIFSNPKEIPNQNCFIVIDVSGSMRCYDLRSFSELWRNDVCDNVFSSISLACKKAIKIVFGCQNSGIHCYEVSRSTYCKLWEYKVEGHAYSTPFCCEKWRSVIVASTKGHVHILDVDSGKSLTSYSFNVPLFSSPLAYGTSVVIGCRDNCLYCLAVS